MPAYKTANACPDFVTEKNIPTKPAATLAYGGPTQPLTLNDQDVLEQKALPLGFLLRGPNPGCPADRVIAYLIQQEARERKAGQPDLADDLREAQIALLLWQRGDRPTLPECFVAASYAVFGTHPDKVFAKVTRHRQEKLGAEYAQWYDAAGNLRPDIPKKASSRAQMKPAANKFDEGQA